MIKQLKSFVACTLIYLVVIGLPVGLIVGSAWFRFHAWRLKHPDAPTWTYFIK